jgi:hypothetical protein
MIKIFAIVIIITGHYLLPMTSILHLLFTLPAYLILVFFILVDIRDYIDYIINTQQLTYKKFSRLKKIRNYITK